MPVRCVTFEVDVVAGSTEWAAVIDALARRYVLGLIGDPPPVASAADGNHVLEPPTGDAVGFRLSPTDVGIGADDPRIFTMAAAAARCYPNEVVHVGRSGASADAIEAVGGRAVRFIDDDDDDDDDDESNSESDGARSGSVRHSDDSATSGPRGAPDGTTAGDVVAVAALRDLPALLDRFDDEDHEASGRVGVGPSGQPWPDGDHLDPELLAGGDRRNVVDRYRYWREEAIVADLDQRRHRFHVAVENWRHDRNIGAVVRNANAFGAGGVHIVGRRRWNRRGAMATDRYLPVHHHDSTDAFVAWARGHEMPVIGIDNVDGSVALESAVLPERCVLVFGQEGPGLSQPMLEQAERVLSIAQFGSTRSINAGVASGIAMHAWIRQHVTGAEITTQALD